MIRVIVEHPLSLRIREWWGGLSPRERWLVGGMLVLLALAILVFGIVKPLQSARAKAIADIRTYETLNARMRAAGTLGPQASAAVQPRTGTPANIVAGAAQAFNLAVQTDAQPGGVRTTVAEGGYDAVMNWLADIAKTSKLAVTRVDIQKRPTPGMVSAVVDFRG